MASRRRHLFWAELAELGLSKKDLGNLPTDFADVYDASRHLVQLFERLMRDAKRRRSQQVVAHLVEIERELLCHLPFHQRSLKTRIFKVAERLRERKRTGRRKGR